jgi:hypothetical protein
MAVLTARQRRRSATIKASRKHPRGRFPMPDKAHARNALARLNQAKGISAEDKRAVKRRAQRMLGKRTSSRRRARRA